MKIVLMIAMILAQASGQILSKKTEDKPFPVTVLYTPHAHYEDAKVEIIADWNKLQPQEVVVGNEVSGSVVTLSQAEAQRLTRNGKLTLMLADAFPMEAGDHRLQVWVRRADGYRTIVKDIEVDIQ